MNEPAALKWACDDAPAVVPVAKLILIALARHADENGQGQLPSDETIADFALTDEYEIPEWLDALSDVVTIGEDRRFALHLPAHETAEGQS